MQALTISCISWVLLQIVLQCLHSVQGIVVLVSTHPAAVAAACGLAYLGALVAYYPHLAAALPTMLFLHTVPGGFKLTAEVASGTCQRLRRLLQCLGCFRPLSWPCTLAIGLFIMAYFSKVDLQNRPFQIEAPPCQGQSDHLGRRCQQYQRQSSTAPFWLQVLSDCTVVQAQEAEETSYILQHGNGSTSAINQHSLAPHDQVLQVCRIGMASFWAISQFMQ